MGEMVCFDLLRPWRPLRIMKSETLQWSKEGRASHSFLFSFVGGYGPGHRPMLRKKRENKEKWVSEWAPHRNSWSLVWSFGWLAERVMGWRASHSSAQRRQAKTDKPNEWMKVKEFKGAKRKGRQLNLSFFDCSVMKATQWNNPLIISSLHFFSLAVMRCKPRKEGERWMMSRLWRNCCAWKGIIKLKLIDSLSVNLKGIEENKQHSSIKQLNSAWLMVCFCFPFFWLTRCELF